MGFWGIEVKPGKPHPYHSDNLPGRLHVTQATLGAGKDGKSVLQCSKGHNSPVYLCSLLADKNECCPLNLVFDDDEMVAFSVVGSRSIHLSGYFETDERDVGDEYEIDTDTDDIADTESDESTEYDSEEDYGDDFMDNGKDDFLMFSSSPAPKSGVVIEEIVDDEKTETAANSHKAMKKKNQPGVVAEDHRKQIVKAGGQIPVSESDSEDEDGFPIPKSKAEKRAENVIKKKNVDNNGEDAPGKKRKVQVIDQGAKSERELKMEKKKQRRKGKDENTEEPSRETNESVDESKKIREKENQTIATQNENNEMRNGEMSTGKITGIASIDKVSAKKKKKKKNKKSKEDEKAAGADKSITAIGDEKASLMPDEELIPTKSSHIREYPNGLVVEELSMGKPDGKRASPGKQVSVRYIGKLKKNGKIFDSNVGGPPLKFRLGLGQVIKGWDVGVNGMRVGDKRRLIIPPSMGYGSRGAGGKIPPNAWLMFDVELVDVR